MSKRETIVRYSRENMPASETDWARLDAMTEAEVDANALSDPDNQPWTAEELAIAELIMPAEGGKEAVYLRLDSEVLAYFKARGPKYQSRINAVLLGYVRSQGMAGDSPAGLIKDSIQFRYKALQDVAGTGGVYAPFGVKKKRAKRTRGGRFVEDTPKAVLNARATLAKEKAAAKNVSRAGMKTKIASKSVRPAELTKRSSGPSKGSIIKRGTEGPKKGSKGK